jgi:hypothetical protein
LTTRAEVAARLCQPRSTICSAEMTAAAIGLKHLIRVPRCTLVRAQISRTMTGALVENAPDMCGQRWRDPLGSRFLWAPDLAAQPGRPYHVLFCKPPPDPSYGFDIKVISTIHASIFANSSALAGTIR